MHIFYKVILVYKMPNQINKCLSSLVNLGEAPSKKTFLTSCNYSNKSLRKELHLRSHASRLRCQRGD